MSTSFFYALKKYCMLEKVMYAQTKKASPWASRRTSAAPARFRAAFWACGTDRASAPGRGLRREPTSDTASTACRCQCPAGSWAAWCSALSSCLSLCGDALARSEGIRRTCRFWCGSWPSPPSGIRSCLGDTNEVRVIEWRLQLQAIYPQTFNAWVRWVFVLVLGTQTQTQTQNQTWPRFRI